jgi:mRNA interferase RelE/StbE
LVAEQVGPYTILFRASALKELDKLPAHVADRAARTIEALSTVPRPPSSVKLAGSSYEYRVRVGDYRVVYVVDDARRQVQIGRIRHRKDVYRD